MDKRSSPRARNFAAALFRPAGESAGAASPAALAEAEEALAALKALAPALEAIPGRMAGRSDANRLERMLRQAAGAMPGGADGAATQAAGTTSGAGAAAMQAAGTLTGGAATQAAGTASGEGDAAMQAAGATSGAGAAAMQAAGALTGGAGGAGGAAMQAAEALPGGAGGAGLERAIRLAALLVRRNLRHLAVSVIREGEQIIDAMKGTLEVRLESAGPMEGDLLDALKQRLAAKTGAKQVRIVPADDPELLGGCRLVMGSEALDASLRGRIAQMAADLGAVIPAGGM